MKFLNDFKNVFAIVGVVSIIFWTCASESTSDDSSSNLPPQITEGYGKYQVAMGSSAEYMVIINTETGVLKSYVRNSINDTFYEWAEGSYMSTSGVVYGSGNLTVNH
tara:strand:+ start:208 stop:528 length:321 start_codon:yes stop_codon:yes gene_type:complete